MVEGEKRCRNFELRTLCADAKTDAAQLAALRKRYRDLFIEHVHPGNVVPADADN